MNRLFFITGLAGCIIPSVALGQIEISARLQHARLLQFEPVLASVRIQNRMPRPVQVGQGEEVEIHFDIGVRPGDYLKERPNARHADSFTVEPGETVSVVINLLDRYPLTRLGPYTIRARLSYAGGLRHSARMYLDIVPGMKIGAAEGSVTGELGGPRRVCTLLHLTRDGREHLFLRFDDPDADLSYGVHDLGSFIRFVDPNLAIDLRGHVHVLHQSAPSRFTHSTFRIDGRALDRVFYTKGHAAIRLVPAPDGEIVVAGGQVYEGDLSVQMPELPPVAPFR